MGGRLRLTARFAAARHAASFALAIVLSAALLLYGAPIALAAGGAPDGESAAKAASTDDSARQIAWSDQIDDMLKAASYVEGEVVAIVAPAGEAASVAALAAEPASAHGSDGLLLDQCEAEELAVTTGEAYENAFDEALPASVIEGAQVEAAAEEGSSGLASAEASDVELHTLLIKKEGMSTEDILRAIAGDPRVVWAEPNYVGTVSDEEAESATSGDAAVGSVAAGDADAGVATPAAAVTDDAASAAATGDGSSASAAAVAATAAAGDESSASLATAAAGDAVEGVTPVVSTIAAADELADATAFQWAFSDGTPGAYGSLHKSGFDVNLAGWNDPSAANAAGVVAVVDTGIDSKNPDLEPVMFDMSPYVSQIGGDAHGYNALADGGDSSDVQGHGTHCAGIVAAAWNGFGVSGAANGAKLISVRAADTDGRFTTAACVKAFAYIGRAVDAGVDVRVASNSWGGEGSASHATYLAVQSVGEKGVAVVFAAGNEHADIDAGLDTAKIQGASDYTTIVDSAMMTGAASEFTNFGKTTTDVFAPGSTVLSTAISQEGSFTGIFFPCLIKDRASLAAFSDFSDGSSSVEAWTGIEQAAGGKAVLGRIGAVDSTRVGYDAASGVLKISKAELAEANKQSSDADVIVSLKVPVNSEKLTELSNASVAIALDGGGATEILGRGALMLEAVGKDGKTSMVGANAGYANPRAGWTAMTVSTERALKEAAEGSQLAVHTASDGSKYIWLHVTIPTSELSQTSADGVLIDCVGAGSKLSPYEYLSGTSMATPCVAGLAAVASTQMEGYDELDGGARAAALTRLLKTSATAYDAFSGLCTSNGMIDASKFSADKKEERTPTITAATLSDDERSITLSGASFGSDAGSVHIGDKDAAVKSWSDDEVVIARPSGLVSGYLNFELARANGKTCNYGGTMAFTEDVSPDDVPVFEEVIDTPAFFDDCSKLNTMAALDGSLYVFGARDLQPEEVDPGNASTKALCYDKVWRYDIDESAWSEVESLPCRLANASCTLWDGKLLVMGSAASENYGGLATKKLFSYDPESGAWTDLSDKVASADVPYQAALVNAAGRLLLIGGSVVAKLPEDEDAASKQGVWVSAKYDVDTAREIAGGDETLMTLTRDNVRAFDLSTGGATVLGTCAPRSNTGMARSSSDIQTALVGDKLYLFGGATADVASKKADQDQVAMECLTLGADNSVTRETVGSYGASSEGTGALPAALEGYQFSAGLASSAEGPLLAGLLATVGQASAEGAKAEVIQDDTFVLKNGATAFTSIGKRVSYTPTVYDRAIAYRGKLYVLGHDYNGSYETVMRATAIATNEVPGDVTRGADHGDTPDGEGGTEPGSGAASGAKGLAKTGDSSLPASVCIAFAGAASLALACAVRRRLARSGAAIREVY